MKKFPTLYKKTSTGAIQEWTISVYINKINTVFGQVGGKLQVTEDIISSGKNIGKKNETTADEQALLEAKAKWEKQKKKGYVETIESAEADEVDEIIEGGVSPMLAFTFEKQGKKIKYPCIVQPKLDGIRMIAVVKNGKCTLWTRSRKPITSLPHIIEEIEMVYGHSKGNIILDGEAYNHEFKDNFEHIVHLVRQEEPDAQHTDVQYHIYDVASSDRGFVERSTMVDTIFFVNKNLKYLKQVKNDVAKSESDVSDMFIEARLQGYEGVMLRNVYGMYVNKRSTDLIKVKEMQDAEFKIVGIEEGRGKLIGHVGSFICEADNGEQFNVKMSGDTDMLKQYFNRHSLWRGKYLTVQYQDLTKYGIPRFPVGLRIREDE